MPEFASDEAVTLDATVGCFEGVRKEAALAEDPAALHVAVVGDGRRTPTPWVSATT